MQVWPGDSKEPHPNDEDEVLAHLPLDGLDHGGDNDDTRRPCEQRRQARVVEVYARSHRRRMPLVRSGVRQLPHWSRRAPAFKGTQRRWLVSLLMGVPAMVLLVLIIAGFSIQRTGRERKSVGWGFAWGTCGALSFAEIARRRREKKNKKRWDVAPPLGRSSS